MLQSWLVIGGVTLIVAFVGSSLTPKDGLRWFNCLQRPRWLTFERAIPVIWTIIFIWSPIGIYTTCK